MSLETTRAIILSTGWPILIIGSVWMSARTLRFYRVVKESVFGKLAVLTISAFLITMYSLGIVSTSYMMRDVEGTRVVLPVFFIWFVIMAFLVATTLRWSKEADTLQSVYAGLEQEVARRVRELTTANKRLGELLGENYASGKLLVQKDRELTTTNDSLLERSKELDAVAKMLVKRDYDITRLNERLTELDETKSEFVSIAAHQLRTPLTGIKWTLRMLLDEEAGFLTDDQKKMVSDSMRAVNRLIDLMNDLLNVARLEEGRYGFEFKKRSIMPIVEQVVLKFQHPAEAKRVHLAFHAASHVSSVSIDAEKMTIALDNLVDNAVKYAHPGGTVDVRVEQEEHAVLVEVKDTGIGIPSDQFERIFTKFFRGRNVQLAKTSGTGLGLYLAYNIIKQHGGSLSFISKEGEGTTFSCYLPASQ